MRAFWLVILVLALGVGAYALFGGGGGARPITTPEPRTIEAGPARPTESAVAAPASPAPAPTETAGANPASAEVAAPVADHASTKAGSTLESLRKQRADAMLKIQTLREQVTQVELSIERMPDRAATLNARLEELRAQVRRHELQADELAAQIGALAAALPAPTESAAPTTAKPVATGETAAPEPAAAETAAGAAPDAAPVTPTDLALFTAPARIAGFEVTPGKVEARAQGGVLVDTRFVIKGSGTASDPFVVPWEMLTSAEEGFAPQAGRKQIPQRVAMLDGKYVRVKGYVAFPLAMDEPRELLAMLNQWDGCCIGVPPTPYDAIEVQLKAGAKGDDRFAISGEVAGRFSVKPYVVGDWLVGMYVMENAEFKARGAPGT